MSMTPIPPGSVIYVGRDDDDDPRSSLTAYLVKTSPEEEWVFLAQSAFAGNDGEYYELHSQNFVWAMSGLAAFHNLAFQNETGIEKP
jgi:hypothetical protein